jgi:hypothetical protein
MTVATEALTFLLADVSSRRFGDLELHSLALNLCFQEDRQKGSTTA